MPKAFNKVAIRPLLKKPSWTPKELNSKLSFGTQPTGGRGGRWYLSVQWYLRSGGSWVRLNIWTHSNLALVDELIRNLIYLFIYLICPLSMHYCANQSGLQQTV